MSVRETVELDLGRLDHLIAQEEGKLEPRHRASIAYREVVERTLAGGVASSWQDSPPHAIYVDRGEGSRIWDIDGNEYIDFHLGYGAMVVGHAHPRIVEAVERQIRRGSHFAQPSRDLLIKIEGSYHGHHDSLMFSVIPEPELIGPREHPVTLPQVPGIPQAFAELVRVVPFNDLAEVERALAENDGKVAGMIVEPAMMNCGVILPDPGYLKGLKDLLHKHGAFLAFDEVKTGATVAYGGAVEAFGVTPDIVCLAKAFGGGLPCGGIGATKEVFEPVLSGEMDMAGTFNGNPLTLAASKAALTEVLTRDAYDHLNDLHRALAEGCGAVIEKYRLPAYVAGLGAKGSVIYSASPVKEYRDAVGIDERITYLAWLFQQNRGVFKSPWSKQETWTTSVAHTVDDTRRYVENFEEFAAAISA